MFSNNDRNNTDNVVDRELNIFEVINHKIEHEDNLFAGRITWFVSLQTLLFFPVFFIFSQKIEDSKNLTEFSETFFRYQEDIILGLTLTGLSFCLIVLLSCQAAHLRINQLIKLYRFQRNQFRQYYLDYVHLVLNVESPPLIRLLGFFASFGSIFIFSKLWLFLEAITNINRNIIIISMIVVTIIDCLVIYNLFDCIFDFFNCEDSQKFLYQVVINLFVIMIYFFICSYIIFKRSIVLIFPVFIVVVAILLFGFVIQVRLYIFNKEKYSNLKRKAVIKNEKITMQNLEDVSFFRL